MSKLKEHTRHHYIPQCYLTNFSEDGKGIWVYNKRLSKSYQTSIDKICYKNNFYKIDNEQFLSKTDNKLDNLSIETKFFAEEIEADYSKLLRYTINKALLELSPENIEFDYEYKRHLAKHIAIQFLRLEEIREAISYNINDMKQAIKGLLERSNLYDKECAKSMRKSIEASEDEVLNHFFCSYGDEELIKTYTDQLCKNYWTMYITQGSYFYTSDFPISVSPEKKDVQVECMGLTQEGGVLIFPISKNILLKIRDYRHFTDYKKLDCKCCSATEKLVRQENIRQYLYANELVISPTNHFEIPQFMNSLNGKELFMHPNFKSMTFNK